MKKTLFLSLLAVVAIAFSCQRVDESINLGQSAKYPNLKATISPDTKVSIDGTALQWTAGDQISVTKDGKTAIYQALSSGATSEFEFVSGEWGEGDGNMVAYYPATLNGAFPSEYLSEAGELNSIPLRGEIAATEEYFTFRAFGGILRFEVSKASGDKDPMSLSMISLRAKEAISGEFTDESKGDVVASTISEKGSNVLTLKLKTPVELTDAPQCFYLPAPAITYAEGLEVTFSADNCVKKVVTTSAIVLERSHIQPIGITLSSADNDAVAKVTIDGGVTFTACSSLEEAFGSLQGDKANCKVVLLADQTIESELIISGCACTFDGDGHTLTLTGEYPEITNNYQGGITINSSSDIDFVNMNIVGQGLDVTSRDRGIAVVTSVATFGKDVVISGFKNNRPYGGAIWCNYLSTLNLVDNVEIRDCSNVPSTSNYGGGAICSDGVVNVKGHAHISNCHSDFWGGAILNNNGSKTAVITISENACIENCSAGKNGGAFYANGVVTVTDDVVLQNCTAAGGGGAIEVRGKTEISGNVLIKDCFAESYGGGIMSGAASADITVSGNVHITGCRTNGDGGGIRASYVDSKLTILDNVIIDHCSGMTAGGGVMCSGYFVMKGSSKIDSCSARFGGGIRIWRTGTFDEDAVITTCEAERGGGIYDTTNKTDASYAQVFMKGNAKIENCTAQRGGGIYSARCGDQVIVACCTLSDNASITGCTATTSGSVYGGGFFGNGNLVVSDNAIISGNLSVSTSSGSCYGCAVCMGMGAATISGGTFASDSKANSMCVSNAAGSITVTGGRFSNAGAGSLFTKTASSCGPITVAGGFFNKTFNSNVTIADGYTWTDNPNSSAEEQAAYADGLIYAVLPL